MTANEARVAPLLASFAPMTEAQLHENHQAQQIGRRLFLNYCANCHGMSARGAFGFPNLTDDEWLWGGDFESIKTTVHGGRTAAMPAWGTVLGDSGTADMAQYVLSLSGAGTRRGRGAARATAVRDAVRGVPRTRRQRQSVVRGAGSDER